MTNKFDTLYKETIGGSAESNDPIIVFINNLKSQLNTAKHSGHENTLNSEDSDSREYDDSIEDREESGSSFLNENDDDEEDEEIEDDEEPIIDEKQSTKVASNSLQSKLNSDKLPIKKFRKF